MLFSEGISRLLIIVFTIPLFLVSAASDAAPASFQGISWDEELAADIAGVRIRPRFCRKPLLQPNLSHVGCHFLLTPASPPWIACSLFLSVNSSVNSAQLLQSSVCSEHRPSQGKLDTPNDYG